MPDRDFEHRITAADLVAGDQILDQDGPFTIAAVFFDEGRVGILGRDGHARSYHWDEMVTCRTPRGDEPAGELR